jgi:hypothetical protein
MKMNYAFLLEFAGRTEESLRIIDELISAPNADVVTIFKGAGIFAEHGEHKKALAIILIAVKKGFTNLDALKSLLNDDEIAPFKDTPEYEELRQIVEKLEAEQLAAAGKEATKEIV